MASGLKGYLGIGFQAQVDSFCAATSAHWLPFVSETLTSNRPRLDSTAMRMRADEPLSHRGAMTIAGDIVFEPTPYSLAVALYAVLGGKVVTSNAAYRHFVLTPRADYFEAQAPLHPMTIWVGRDITSVVGYFACQANQLSLEFAAGSLMKATLSVIGQREVASVTATPTFADSEQHLIPWSIGSVSLGGIAMPNLMSGTITMGNAIEARQTFNGQIYATQFHRTGFRQPRLSAEMDPSTLSHWSSLFMGDSRETLGAYFYHDANNYVDIGLQNVAADGMPLTVNGPGPVAFSLTGRPQYSTALGYSLIATVRSSVLKDIGTGTLT